MEKVFKSSIHTKEGNIILSTTEVKDIELNYIEDFICGEDFIIPTRDLNYIVAYDAEAL